MHYPHQLSTKYGISIEHIRQLFIEWARAGLISLQAWDNTINQERLWNEWPGPDGVFFTPWDRSAVRIRILARGSRHLETLVNPENAAVEFRPVATKAERPTKGYSNDDSEQATKQLRVFLCHCSEDKAKIRQLYKRLANDGFAPWLDEENLIGGQDWQQEIPKAVRMCHVVLVCLSPSSMTKEGFVQKEIKIALDVAEEKPEGTIFIIPVRLQEGVTVPSRLSQWHCVNLFEENGYDRLVRALSTRSRELGIRALLPGIQDRTSSVQIYGLGSEPGQIFISGSGPSVERGFRVLSQRVTVVNKIQHPINIAPKRLLVGNSEWPARQIIFQDLSTRAKGAITVGGNSHTNYDLHILVPDNLTPAGRTGIIEFQIDGAELLQIKVEFRGN